MNAKTYLQSIKHRGGIYELLRFGIVGAAATAVDLIVTVLLVALTSLHENLITTCAFLCAFSISYFGHRYFTFQKRGSIVLFFALTVCTLLLRNLVVWLLVMYVTRGLPALITGMVVVTVITYFVAKFKIFNKEKTE